MADWGAVVGAFGIGIAGLSYLKSREANRHAQESIRRSDSANEIAQKANDLSQTTNSYASEANRLAIESSRFAREANVTANRAVAFEYQPHFRVTSRFQDGEWEGNPIEMYMVRATNVGRLPTTLVGVIMQFPSTESTYGMSVFSGMDSWRSPLPLKVEPGDSVSLWMTMDVAESTLLAEQHKGQKVFEVVFTDDTGKRHTTGEFPIDAALQRVTMMRKLREMTKNQPWAESGTVKTEIDLI